MAFKKRNRDLEYKKQQEKAAKAARKGMRETKGKKDAKRKQK